MIVINSNFRISETFSHDKKVLPISIAAFTTPHVSGVVGLMMSYWNTPGPNYQNLAPEDCENIIQLSATDVGPGGYDSKNGWGRLNAGNALKLLEKPFRGVYHFGTSMQSSSPYFKTKTLISTGDVVRFKEYGKNETGANVFTWMPYTVNTYRIEAEVNHTLAPDENIVAYWPRPSSSSLYEPIINDSIMPRERITITSMTHNTCKMTGYVYQVFDTSGTFKGWWPHDTTLTKAQFEYSILYYTNNPASVDEHQDKNWVKLFPNPATDAQNLLIQGESDGQELRVELYDMQGRLLRNVYKGNEKSVSIDVSELSPSMYFYRVFLGDKRQTLRFIKQ